MRQNMALDDGVLPQQNLEFPRARAVYTWRKQLFENGTAAFGRDAAGEQARTQEQIKVLQARLASKDEVIADISQEYVRLKKARGVL